MTIKEIRKKERAEFWSNINLKMFIIIAVALMMIGVLLIIGGFFTNNRVTVNAGAADPTQPTHMASCQCTQCKEARKCGNTACVCADCTGACGGNCINGGCNTGCNSNTVSNCLPSNMVINIHGDVYIYNYNSVCCCNFCESYRDCGEVPTSGAPQNHVAPTVAPTTVAPTTVVPSTHVAPITTSGTTAPSTSVETTTAAPTTEASTTAEETVADAREIIGIRAELTKKDWLAGQKITCEYIHVFAVYNDGSQEGPVGGYQCPEANVGHSAGTVTFNITWEGFHCTLNVVFHERPSANLGTGFDPNASAQASIDAAWQSSVDASREAEQETEEENTMPEIVVEETTKAAVQTLPASTEGTTAALTVRATMPVTKAQTTVAPTVGANPEVSIGTPPAETIQETTRVEYVSFEFEF